MDNKSKIAKKTIILYVLNTLKLYSSEENPASQSAIAIYLNDIGVPCDRKTVGRNITYLQEFGYPIKKIHGRGYYIDKKEMESSVNQWII